MVANQHTEATLKKLREAGFFLRLLADLSNDGLVTREPEAAEFYASAFLSAARAVPWALHKERTAAWNAWIDGWRSRLSDSDREIWKFLVDQRNKVHKEGGPNITVTARSVLWMFMPELKGTEFASARGITGLPAGFTKHEKTFTDNPEKSLAEGCQPIFELMSRMMEDFERAHPCPAQ